jgi:hypothetical protein
MQNLIKYESFSGTNSGLRENDEMTSECSGISEDAKEAIKSLCESMLCKEAEDYHNDPDDSHTYEGYINECSNYVKECMGQPGYAGLVKPHAE